MRDKHLHIGADSDLLKKIYQQVEEELSVDRKAFLRLIIFKFIFYFSLMVAAYISLFLVKAPTLFFLCFILYGFISLLFAFNFSHDFSHNTIFKNKAWNHSCFILIYTLLGAHGEAWKQRHIHSHHYAPNVDGYDSDLRISRLIRVIPGSEYCWYHRYQHWYASFAYMTYSLFWVFIKDIVILLSKDEYTKHKTFGYYISFVLQKAIYLIYVLILPLLFSTQPWYIVVSAFLVMHLLQSLFLLFTFFMTHHVETTVYPGTDNEGYIDTSWLMNQVKSSNDMHPFSKTANFILGGFNNHIAHHLFPHVHHIYYPRLNRILYSVLLQHQITPNQTSYWGGVKSHLRVLKKMSHRV